MFREYLGLLKSLLMYYGNPFRARQLQRFYAQFIQPGDLCFDIGAHVGSRLRAWLVLGGKVVAAEPQEICLRLLQRWYGSCSRVTLLPLALGAAPGKETLLVSKSTPSVSTLSSTWASEVGRQPSFSRVRWDTSIPVEVTSLDALIEQYGAPAFCKIDVEGYELEVLKGLSRPVRALSFEYIPATIEIAMDCIKYLAGLGEYQFNWSPGEGLQLQADRWLAGDQVMAKLERLPLNSKSGDIYARYTRSK